MQSAGWLPYFSGGISVVVLFVITKIATGGTVAKLYEGADGRPSTSKFQVLLWTAAVIFSFTALFTGKLQKSDFSPNGDLPNNVLIAMGISIASASAAKAITTNYVNINRIDKKPIPSGSGHFGQIFQADS